MSKVQLNSYALIVLMLVVMTGIKLGVTPQSEAAKTEFKTIPLTIGDWEGEEHPFDETTQRLLPTASLLYRIYQRPIDIAPCALAIVHGIELGNFHQPEVCLEGQGLKSIDKGIVKIKDGHGGTFDAVSLVTERDYQRQVFVFWFYSDGGYSTSLGSYKMKILVNRMLRKGIKPSAMIRLNTYVLDTEEEALERLVQFAGSIAPHLEKEFDRLASEGQK